MNEAAAAATIFYRQFLSELFAADLCRGRVQGHGGPRGDISFFLRPKKKEKDCNKTSPINLLLFYLLSAEKLKRGRRAANRSMRAIKERGQHKNGWTQNIL